MQTDVTIVFQSGKNNDYKFGAFHIKSVSSDKLKEAFEMNDVSVIDHIIVYEKSIIKNTHRMIYGQYEMVEFFNNWKVEY